jgi:hypothetical protein
MKLVAYAIAAGIGCVASIVANVPITLAFLAAAVFVFGAAISDPLGVFMVSYGLTRVFPVLRILIGVIAAIGLGYHAGTIARKRRYIKSAAFDEAREEEEGGGGGGGAEEELDPEETPPVGLNSRDADKLAAFL